MYITLQMHMIITEMKTICSVWAIGVLFVIIHVEAVTEEEFKSLLARLSVLEEKQAFSEKRIAALETENKLSQKRITDLEKFKTLSFNRIIAFKRDNRLCNRRNDAHYIVKKLTNSKGVSETDKILSEKDSITYKYDESVSDGASLKQKHILFDKKISPLEYYHAMTPKRGAAEIGNDEVGMVQRPIAVLQSEHRRFVAEGIVAFFALKSAHQNNVGINQNIIFEKVITNEGGGYHPNHSVFIAPRSGMYVISSSIMTNQNGECDAHIVHNGNVVSRIYGHGDNGRHDQGSQTIVIRLKAGDEVAVQNEYPANTSIYGDLFSAFSGFLLWPQ